MVKERQEIIELMEGLGKRLETDDPEGEVFELPSGDALDISKYGDNWSVTLTSKNTEMVKRMIGFIKKETAE